MKVCDLLAVEKTIAPYMAERFSAEINKKLFLLGKKIRETAKEFYITEWQKLVNDLAKKDEKGKVISKEANGIITVEFNDIERAKRDHEKILQTDFEKPDITFTWEEVEEMRLSADDIGVIFEFIKE